MKFGIATYGFRPEHIVSPARHAKAGEPTCEGLKTYVDAGFDTLVVPCEAFQGKLGFDMTLVQKIRRLDEMVRALKLQA